MEDNWIPISEDCPNAIIRTLHEDGKEDTMMVIDNTPYIHDPVTESPVTHFKIIELKPQTVKQQ